MLLSSITPPIKLIDPFCLLFKYRQSLVDVPSAPNPKDCNTPNLLFNNQTRRRARPSTAPERSPMGYIKFKSKKTVQKVIVSEESPHVIRITGDDLKVNTDGFRLYMDPDCKYPLDNGEYEAYTTLYREGEGWYELSNDGSVYTEPEVAPVQPELTEEEKAELARQQQISQVTAQIDDLKNRIAASDYKIIKTYEYTLLGEQTEYDIEAVHAERQALRDQINVLETQLADLTVAAE